MDDSHDQSIELGFDRPLNPEDALTADKLGRRGYAQAAVDALGRVSATNGFVLSVEGPWGSGKTSSLAMMEALLRELQPTPVIVHFNPWLVGDRDALLRLFLSKIAAEVKLTDHAADGKNVARQLKSYAKVFDFVKMIPGAEPWASLVKSVVESAGESVDAVATYKTPNIEAQKAKVAAALQRFRRPIIVFIDDIDRLFPLEVFEMVRIVKAVGDLPNVGYVLAWDPAYVSKALKAVHVPRPGTYLDKVVQLRMPLPAISREARGALLIEALGRLPAAAHTALFANAQDRLSEMYFSGFRELLEQPRDFARVFNTVSVIEPALRGEVVLADIIGLAALMVKAPRVFELLRREPRGFVGFLPGDQALLKKSEEFIQESTHQRDAAINQSTSPRAVRALMHFLFPLTAHADDEFAPGYVREIEGHIAAPPRLLVALQLHISGGDVSYVMARRYLSHPAERSQIAGALTEQNCVEFLECLGDVAEAAGTSGVDNLEALCLDIARLADTGPFPARAQDRTDFYLRVVEDVAVRAIRLFLKPTATKQAAAIAERIVSDPTSLTVAMRLFADSYLSSKTHDPRLHCPPEIKATLADALARNMLAAARAGRLLTTCNPAFLLWRLPSVAPSACPKVLEAMRSVDSTLDGFALAILKYAFDSTKGQQYALPDDRSTIEAYGSLRDLQEHAAVRLEDPALTLPALAAWRAVVTEKSVYGCDGSYAAD